MMKKLLAVLLCLSLVSVLSIGVVGCDKKDTTKKEKEATDKKEKEATDKKEKEATTEKKT